MTSAQYLQDFFSNFDKKLNQTSRTLSSNFEALLNQIEALFDTNLSLEQTSAGLNTQRFEYLESLIKHRNNNLYESFNYKDTSYLNYKFKPSNVLIKNVVEHLGELRLKAGFGLNLKVKYLNLANTYAEIDLSQLTKDCIEVKVLVLSKNRIFAYLRKVNKCDSCLVLFNEKCVELYRRSLTCDFYYDTFMAYQAYREEFMKKIFFF